MYYKILSKKNIGEELLPMSEINDHLRVYDPHEEELLSIYRDAAIDYAERYMNRSLSEATAAITYPYYRKSVQLPLGEVTNLTSIEALDNEGNLVRVEKYRFNPVSGVVSVMSYYRGCTDFVLTFDVGYKVDQVPKAIKLGILKLISTWYENREDISNGVSVAAIPFNHLNCFNLYRIPSGS